MKMGRDLRYLRAGALTAGASLVASACALSTDSGQEPEATTEAPIIAGVPANGAKLNAIGSIGNLYVDPETQESFYQPFCSGSLIGAQTVLTAKHCIRFFASDYQSGLKTVFAIGPDASAPSRLIEVVEVRGAPGDVGGFVDQGHDVGVMYLAEKPTELTPLKLATLKPKDLGKPFIEIGYGVRDNTYAYGTRRAGNATLRATSGRIFEIIFGSFERFKSWAETGSPGSEALFVTGPVAPHAFLPLARSLYASLGPADVNEAGAGGIANGGGGGTASGGSPGAAGEVSVGGEVSIGGEGGGFDPDAYLRSIYDNTLLDEGYEALFGGAKGDAQACYGDSGSPIVRSDANGNLLAYGVISGGIGSSQLVCDYGGVDALFGPDVMPFLQTAKRWVDPCKGATVEGKCSGKSAVRCTSPLEGPRRLVKFNCGSLGQVCALQPDGTAGCSDP
jgi:V8-like Glu-specific endopeptidase